MVRILLAFFLLPFLSGCLVETPNEAQTGGPSGSDPNDPAFTREAIRVLGRIYLHNDGTRQWMDTDSGDAQPLPGATATSQGVTYTFPYEPTLSEDVMTSGLAQFSLATSQTFAASGGAPVFVATILVDGTASGSAAGSGTNVVLIPIPTLIRAGSALALEVCFCGAATDASAVVFEPDLSLLDIPGPATTECGPDALPTGRAEVVPNGSQWMAKRTDRGTGPAPQRYETLDLTTHNGGIEVQRGGSGTYTLEATLHAYGRTADEARASLDALCIEVERSRDGTALTAALIATDGVTQAWNNRGADLDLTVPTASATDVRLDASNGAINLEGLQVGTLGIDTSNGDVVVHADAQDATIDSSNAGIDLRGAFGDLDASTSNGDIDIDIRPAGTGSLTWLLDSSNAAIRGTVATGATIGYDARASTSNDDASLDLAGAQPVGEQDDDEKHVRTQGYDTRETRVDFTLDTSNAEIDVSG